MVSYIIDTLFPVVSLDVLILVVVDDGLVRAPSPLQFSSRGVLILVVVDDGLVQICHQYALVRDHSS